MVNPSRQESCQAVDSRWYETLAELSPVGIFFTDADGNCLHVNRRWCEIAGFASEQAMGRGWIQGIHNEDLERVADLWYESARNNQPFHAEYRFTTPQGKATWVIGDARAVLAKDGTVDGYIGTITDVDKSKQCMDELEQSKEQIRTIITEMPVILFAFDKQRHLCAWNQEAERVTGYTASEMIGNPDAMSLLCPDSANRHKMLDSYKQRGDDYRDWEWELTAKDGSIKFIAFSNISKHHPINGWRNWGIGVDVTSRRNTEHKLCERIKELNCLYKLSLLSNQPNLDLDMFLSEVVELLPPSWQYPETTCTRIIFEDRIFKTDFFVASQWMLCSSIHVRGRKVGLIEVYYVEQRPPATEGPFLLEERMLIDEIALQVSRTIGHVLAKKDLTLLDELSAKAGELEQFSHTVSHDLKTPLTAIGGFAQLLNTQLNKGDSSQAKSCCKRIVDITRRMEHRLNELLKLAKMGKIIDPTEEIDFKDIIDETVSMMEQRFDEARILVKVASNFPTILGDRVRLLEVVEILLDNAIKYIGEHPNQISVDCRGEGYETIFFVKDNGIGIQPEQLDAIFGLFTRLDKNSDGDGAGLAIAKRIINAHGGQLWAESEGVGKGSCFCFTFGALV
ncbi:MAG: PAS domain-containing sensor histidine kinase [Deltaproteobacteria bacterium]|nr:PAS domain-containing sensor histidine kinase [Deltaproteobacteria bacterium]